MSAERVEDLVAAGEETITDTIPASVMDAVIRYYARHGYGLRRFVLVTGSRYEATFDKQEGSR